MTQSEAGVPLESSLELRQTYDRRFKGQEERRKQPKQFSIAFGGKREMDKAEHDQDADRREPEAVGRNRPPKQQQT